jgi:AcrR family transcriptional regulator
MIDPQALIDPMADHVLAHGLGAATLRPLARAAGTSDRMLIYHFASKERLLSALLDRLAERLTRMLDASPLPPAGSTTELSRAVLALLRSPEAGPYVAVWFEVVAGAARGDPVCRDTGGRILQHFRGWLAARLPPATPAPEAAALLLRIEGSLLADQLGDAGRALTNAAEPPT